LRLLFSVRVFSRLLGGKNTVKPCRRDAKSFAYPATPRLINRLAMGLTKQYVEPSQSVSIYAENG
jgi:hypothetical protein